MDHRGKQPPEIMIDVQDHYPSAIDDVAQSAPPSRNFLRAAWFSGDTSDGAATLIARTKDGTAFAAFPTRKVRPRVPRIRAIAGAYWPFRTLVVRTDACPRAIHAMIAHPRFRRMFSPLWRMGPVYSDDSSVQLVLQGMRDNGWHILTRNLGATWRFNIGPLARDNQWPRKSTMKRLRGYEGQLTARYGDIRYEVITGKGWTNSAFELLADIERRSWVGKDSQNADAKFINPSTRRYWAEAVKDPAIADLLSATVLYTGDTAIAFSFDLRSGDMQYAIASSYDDDYAAYRPGKIVTYHQFRHAVAQGIEVIDLGAGDNGYKSQMGAEQGAEICDYLVIRYGWLARLLKHRWAGGGAANGCSNSHITDDTGTTAKD